jgi:hypothetical protein
MCISYPKLMILQAFSIPRETCLLPLANRKKGLYPQSKKRSTYDFDTTVRNNGDKGIQNY